jgi:endoglucanase
MDQAIGGGAYGDDYVEDDFYWAACELYATTGESQYYDDLSTYQNEDADDKAFSLTTNLGGGENNGSFTSFNWGCTAGLGTLTLYLSDNTSAADKATIEASITKTADKYIAKEEEQGMGIPYQSATFQDAVNIGEGIDVTGYEWGSNSFVVNNAIVMAYAYNVTADEKYINGVSEAMDYIFGRNGLGFSYVTGYGTYHLENPHHRYWSYSIDSSFPMAPAGVMSGGPGSGMQDPYIGGLGYKRGTLAPQKCYVDSAEAWSVNEVTINWNAPFAWVVSFLEDEAPEVSSDKLTVTPSKVTLAVGDSETITAKVSGEAVTIDSMTSSSSAVEISGSTIKAVSASTSPVTVTVTAGGQTATITVTISDTAATDATDSTDTSSTGATIDTSKAATLWGDVDCNNAVEVADVVTLNMYLLDTISNGDTISAQGLVNANCEFDDSIDMADTAKIINYLAELIPYSDLGNQ